ncbi:MAG: tail fiber domain-containing protein [Chitinophagaceae bacterium]|nr:tail fiber domain-containing protein [Chitinophagaceae bacterium]
MKPFSYLIGLIFIISIPSFLHAQGVAISLEKSKPDTSAMLDVISTKKGVLIPRLSLAGIQDKNTIPEPAHSLLVYNTNDDLNIFPLRKGYYQNAGGPFDAKWVRVLTEENAWLLTGNPITTDDNFIGTINEQDVVFKTNSMEALRIGKGATLLAGNYSDVIDDFIPEAGPGTRLMWLPARHAFRAGIALNTEWDADNIGMGSFAVGSNVKASGIYSVAMGNNTEATNTNTIAMGQSATASGFGSVALGNQVKAIGSNSMATGFKSTANNKYSSAFGEETFSNAIGGMAIGRFNEKMPVNLNPICTDRIFQIGNGTGEGIRRDALYVTRLGDLWVNGKVTANNGVVCPSDIRLKEEIQPLESVLKNIKNIQPISYFFKDKETYPSTHQIGFSAQEIEQQFPELITKNEKGLLSVKYPQMPAIAIQGRK